PPLHRSTELTTKSPPCEGRGNGMVRFGCGRAALCYYGSIGYPAFSHALTPPPSAFAFLYPFPKYFVA
ncbi:MAG: hypothetical protein KGQ83_09130, partial [Planctomycetes bacterium]|nr:hypothetical protein [Planctomycetota bacterium]